MTCMIDRCEFESKCGFGRFVAFIFPFILFSFLLLVSFSSVAPAETKQERAGTRTHALTRTMQIKTAPSQISLSLARFVYIKFSRVASTVVPFLCSTPFASPSVCCPQPPTLSTCLPTFIYA